MKHDERVSCIVVEMFMSIGLANPLLVINFISYTQDATYTVEKLIEWFRLMASSPKSRAIEYLVRIYKDMIYTYSVTDKNNEDPDGTYEAIKKHLDGNYNGNPEKKINSLEELSSYKTPYTKVVEAIKRKKVNEAVYYSILCVKLNGALGLSDVMKYYSVIIGLPHGDFEDEHILTLCMIFKAIVAVNNEANSLRYENIRLIPNEISGVPTNALYCYNESSKTKAMDEYLRYK
jgi:hypothetical protein